MAVFTLALHAVANIFGGSLLCGGVGALIAGGIIVTTTVGVTIATLPFSAVLLIIMGSVAAIAGILILWAKHRQHPTALPNAPIWTREEEHLEEEHAEEEQSQNPSDDIPIDPLHPPPVQLDARTMELRDGSDSSSDENPQLEIAAQPLVDFGPAIRAGSGGAPGDDPPIPEGAVRMLALAAARDAIESKSFDILRGATVHIQSIHYVPLGSTIPEDGISIAELYALESCGAKVVAASGSLPHRKSPPISRRTTAALRERFGNDSVVQWFEAAKREQFAIEFTKEEVCTPPALDTQYLMTKRDVCLVCGGHVDAVREIIPWHLAREIKSLGIPGPFNDCAITLDEISDFRQKKKKLEELVGAGETVIIGNTFVQESKLDLRIPFCASMRDGELVISQTNSDGGVVSMEVEKAGRFFTRDSVLQFGEEITISQMQYVLYTIRGDIPSGQRCPNICIFPRSFFDDPAVQALMRDYRCCVFRCSDHGVISTVDFDADGQLQFGGITRENIDQDIMRILSTGSSFFKGLSFEKTRPLAAFARLHMENGLYIFHADHCLWMLSTADRQKYMGDIEKMKQIAIPISSMVGVRDMRTFVERSKFQQIELADDISERQINIWKEAIGGILFAFRRNMTFILPECITGSLLKSHVTAIFSKDAEQNGGWKRDIILSRPQERERVVGILGNNDSLITELIID
ncbi:MAG: hypothetical protein LBC42_01555 [Puniceicoccales bacterium]|jgi:hypothetical protein|nr:hypothetical protein [Puniceicoccales bacterium]